MCCFSIWDFMCPHICFFFSIAFVRCISLVGFCNILLFVFVLVQNPIYSNTATRHRDKNLCVVNRKRFSLHFCNIFPLVFAWHESKAFRMKWKQISKWKNESISFARENKKNEADLTLFAVFAQLRMKMRKRGQREYKLKKKLNFNWNNFSHKIHSKQAHLKKIIWCYLLRNSN